MHLQQLSSMSVVTLLLLSITFIFNNCCFAVMTSAFWLMQWTEITILIRWNWRADSGRHRCYFRMDSNSYFEVLGMKSFQKYCLSGIFALCWSCVVELYTWPGSIAGVKTTPVPQNSAGLSVQETAVQETGIRWRVELAVKFIMLDLQKKAVRGFVWKFCKEG